LCFQFVAGGNASLCSVLRADPDQELTAHDRDRALVAVGADRHPDGWALTVAQTSDHVRRDDDSGSGLAVQL